MPIFEGSDEDKTETATAYRREEFRKQGTVALSREVLGVVMLLAVGTTLYFGASKFREGFAELARRFFVFGSKMDFQKEDFSQFSIEGGKTYAGMVLPAFVVAMIAGILACGAQVGFHMTWEPLTPNWDRINPASGIKKIFSATGFVEALKAVLKICIATWITWIITKDELLQIGFYFQKSVPEISLLVLTSLGRLGVALTLSLAFLAVADYAWQRFQLERMMRMTRREAKEEMKLRDGDPFIKSRIRNIQRRIASRRMMEQVKKADVIVTNPTHIAIALQYDLETMEAPRMTAKGAGVIAEKIKEIGRFHRVPIVENKPLARTLYKELEIGQTIPRELYKAVAEVLAYVFKLRGIRKLGEQAVSI